MIWLAGSVALQLSALVLLKLAATDRPGWLELLFRPYFILALLALVMQSAVWQMALRRYPLNVAYSCQAALFPVAMAIGVIWFGEGLSWSKICGVCLIAMGIAWQRRTV